MPVFIYRSVRHTPECRNELGGFLLLEESDDEGPLDVGYQFHSFLKSASEIPLT